MRNLRLTLAYDGTAYVGWQVQPNGVSVQAVVEQAIQRLTGEEVRVFAAGRTDSGVHAIGQVANFYTKSTIPVGKFVLALQRFLPEDVIVREVREVPEDFHATYSATRKRYRYLIHNSRIPDPFLRRYVWRFGGKLDASAMHAAAQSLVGTHDFRAFESQWPNKSTSVRTVMEATVQRVAHWDAWTAAGPPARALTTGAAGQPTHAASGDTGPAILSGGERSAGEHSTEAAARSRNEIGSPGGAGDIIAFDIVADGFLYNMVRAIVGTLVEVGRGRWTVEDVRRILDSGKRSGAGDTAPARGLYLVSVDYD